MEQIQENIIYKLALPVSKLVSNQTRDRLHRSNIYYLFEIAKFEYPKVVKIIGYKAADELKNVLESNHLHFGTSCGHLTRKLCEGFHMYRIFSGKVKAGPKEELPKIESPLKIVRVFFQRLGARNHVTSRALKLISIVVGPLVNGLSFMTRNMKLFSSPDNGDRPKNQPD